VDEQLLLSADRPRRIGVPRSSCARQSADGRAGLAGVRLSSRHR